ncbi:UDP-glucose/GDP-mannose dehydrogenase family protein [Mailhella massiliensis]|uniref:UDP-glucose 6-dehydrogenase n=1 Tax=Mailhella massiliensis TaxID=1903261 RepID=A0A921DRH8_9BACT|nr:UDP-glucose/GDP-mannose dehydrogenase family protein [Mailhella massiliensis]HJD97715.1 UDP-glucose/GDP-mannose dehydrogenase family protein [Mailhella massiliensis]
MNISVIGSGYVGLVTAACLAETGHDVRCMDTDEARIDSLRAGFCPIYEPKLPELLERNAREGRLHFSASLAETLDGADAAFIAVGTPEGEDGSADIRYVCNAAHSVGRLMTGDLVVVVKSTVPVGTSVEVERILFEELARRGEKFRADVASNPEFLKEGHAVDDFMMPDRVIVGVKSELALKVMTEIYRPFLHTEEKLLVMDRASSELTKYTANAMLATRISFMNDIANLCEEVGANVDMVREGIGMDRRIGESFLQAGCGYGGSCFPKDVKALIATARRYGRSLSVLEAVEKVNDAQKKVLFAKISRHFRGHLEGRTIALWGLAFKPGTDDMREAPSLTLIHALLAAGCRVRAFDPAAINKARALLGDAVYFAEDMYKTAEGAEALALVTEWDTFRRPDWQKLGALMKSPVIFDGRGIYRREEAENAGFTLYRIG